MKNILRSGLFLLFATVLTLSVSAQGNRSQRDMDPAKMVETQLERMDKELDLSDEQEAKVKEVLLKYANQMKEQREKSNGQDRDAMRDAMQKIREAQNKEIKEILTAEQYAKYEKMQSERRQGGQGNRGGQGRPRN